MRDNIAQRRDRPCFIKPEDEHKWSVGLGADMPGFVPEGVSAEFILSGRFPEDRVATKKAKK